MIRIDYRSGRPIYEQLVNGFEKLVLNGCLKPGDQIPSVRQMALELSINPNTIHRAYTELERRSIIFSVKGRGSYVTTDTQLIRHEREQNLRSRLESLAAEARASGMSEEGIVSALQDGYNGIEGESKK